MTEIYVDIPGLNQVHRTLHSIRYDLADFDSSYARSHSEAMGHREVVRAFSNFVDGWSDGRQLINEQLEVACKKIEAAVSAYLEAEDVVGGMANDMKGGMQ